MSAPEENLPPGTEPPRAVSRFMRSVLSDAFSILFLFGNLVAEGAGQFWSVVVTRLRRLALHATGVDDDHLKAEGTPEERNRFLILGSIVILTACFATVGSVFFFWQVLEPRAAFWVVPAAIGLAILWGLMIFNIDRIFLTTMLGKKHWWQRLCSGFFRLILAGLLGYVISHPLKILFFWDTINAYDLFQYEKHLAEYKETRETEIANRRDDSIEGVRKLRELNLNDATAGLENDAKEQLQLASDLVDRETDFDGRKRIVKKYSDTRGVIPGLRPPLQDGEPMKFDAPLIGKPGCEDTDVLLLEYHRLQEGGEKITDPWLRKLVGTYRDYARDPTRVEVSSDTSTNPRIQTSRRTTPNKVYDITSCGIGTILKGRWEIELDKLRKRKLGGTDNSEEIRNVQVEIELNRQEIEQAQEDVANAEALVRERTGTGYAYRTALLWRLSRPGDIAAEIRGDEKLTAHAFFNSAQRTAIFWIGWAIAAIFIFVEMAPVLAKIFLSPGPYEQNLGERRDEKGDESAEERRRKRQFDEQDGESAWSHRLAIRNQARAFWVGAQRMLSLWLSKEIEKSDAPEDHDEIFSIANARHDELWKFTEKLYRTVGDGHGSGAEP